MTSHRLVALQPVHLPCCRRHAVPSKSQPIFLLYNISYPVTILLLLLLYLLLLNYSKILLTETERVYAEAVRNLVESSNYCGNHYPQQHDPKDFQSYGAIVTAAVSSTLLHPPSVKPSNQDSSVSTLRLHPIPQSYR